MEQLESLIPLLIAVVGSAGLWTYMKQRSELAFQARMNEQNYRGEFNESLKLQVDRLSSKIDELNTDKEELLLQMAELRAELGEARATIKHLEALLIRNNA